MVATKIQLFALLFTAVVGFLPQQAKQGRILDCGVAGKTVGEAIVSQNPSQTVHFLRACLNSCFLLNSEEDSYFYDNLPLVVGYAPDRPIAHVNVEVCSVRALESSLQIPTFKLAPKQGPPALSA